jgi:hypothetical protein
MTQAKKYPYGNAQKFAEKFHSAVKREDIFKAYDTLDKLTQIGVTDFTYQYRIRGGSITRYECSYSINPGQIVDLLELKNNTALAYVIGIEILSWDDQNSDVKVIPVDELVEDLEYDFGSRRALKLETLNRLVSE